MSWKSKTEKTTEAACDGNTKPAGNAEWPDNKKDAGRITASKTDTTEYGPAPVFGFKALICCISVVMYALFVAVQFAVLLDNNRFNNVSQQDSLEIEIAVGIAAILFIVAIFLTTIYAIFMFNAEDEHYNRYFIAFRNSWQNVALLLFVLISLDVAWITLRFSTMPILSATIIAASTVIAYCPIAIAARIDNEERLKNFIDGFSKACSCMTFMAGGIAFILNVFILK